MKWIKMAKKASMAAAQRRATHVAPHAAGCDPTGLEHGHCHEQASARARWGAKEHGPVASRAGRLAAAVAGALVVARRHLVVVRVLGDSMAPTLLAGDLVLVRRGGRRIRAGSVVVFPPPLGVLRAGPAGPLGWDLRRVRGPWVIKRVVALPGDAVPESVRGAVGGPLSCRPGLPGPAGRRQPEHGLADLGLPACQPRDGGGDLAAPVASGKRWRSSRGTEVGPGGKPAR